MIAGRLNGDIADGDIRSAVELNDGVGECRHHRNSVSCGRWRPEVQHAFFTVDVVFPRAVQFFEDVEIVITLVFREAVGAEGLCGINRPGSRVNGFYPLELVGPINRPVAMHPGIAGQLPSFGTITVEPESAVMTADGDAVLLDEKDTLVIVIFARLGHIGYLYPALVGITGDGHGLTVEEQFHTHFAVRPAVIPDLAVFVYTLCGKVGP